ncbi:hypothetical protein M3J09_003018 [Ascochyta lentis]
MDLDYSYSTELRKCFLRPFASSKAISTIYVSAQMGTSKLRTLGFARNESYQYIVRGTKPFLSSSVFHPWVCAMKQVSFHA